MGVIQGVIGTRVEAGSQISGELAAETLKGRETVQLWFWMISPVQSEHDPRGIGPAPWDGGGEGPERGPIPMLYSGETGARGRHAVWATKADASGMNGTALVMMKGRVFAPTMLDPGSMGRHPSTAWPLPVRWRSVPA